MNDNNEQAVTDPIENGSAVADADELQRQRDDFYDRLLRKTAEFDNYRKRVERDRQSMSDAVAADVVRDLLPESVAILNSLLYGAVRKWICQHFSRVLGRVIDRLV